MEKRLNQQEEIERLFTKVREYYKSDNFWTLMKFCARFKQLSPYNAWMAQLQCPGATYVLTEQAWKKRYKRKLRTNARPIIILVPFGPIGMVFDISDTMPESGDSDSTDNIERILYEIEHPFITGGRVHQRAFDRLKTNLSYYGIAYEPFDVGAGYAARIMVNGEKTILIETSKGVIKQNNDYLLNVNSKAEKGEIFASICHELGHLFCHHLPNQHARWDVRHLTHNEQEFEAETVSWLMCERAGVENPSERYLAEYTDENGNIPHISINAVLLAVGEIERMVRDTPSEALKHGLLYKYSKEFKEIIKSQG